LRFEVAIVGALGEYPFAGCPGEFALINEAMRALFQLFQQGRISPRVDRVFPLSEGAAAHNFLQERRNVGKVLFDCA
jgi:DNA phosphorothioation-dependent restriction protein DptG